MHIAFYLSILLSLAVYSVVMVNLKNSSLPRAQKSRTVGTISKLCETGCVVSFL